MVDYIKQIQRIVTELLEEHKRLSNRSHDVLYRIFAAPDISINTAQIDCTKDIDEIDRKIHDVNLLQIRIPIVASMKAGKSTIVNALIGGEYLPTRTDAMTALPTAVALRLGQTDSDRTDPVQLILKNETLTNLKNLTESVIKLLKDNLSDEKQLEALFKSNNYLVKTARNLRDVDGYSSKYLHSTLSDKTSIQETLTFINELVRLAFYIEMEYREKFQLPITELCQPIPILNVRYEAVGNSSNLSFQHECQILLIDTPGPNEAAGVIPLKTLMENELRKADMVLNIVEYGHVNTESDAKIANCIATVRTQRREERFMYVLVNKSDLRKNDEMTEEQLKAYVAGIYGVPQDCVFELSGSRALVARRYLAEYRENKGKIIVGQSDTAQRVLEVYHPINWRKQLNKRPEEVKSMAEEVYESSGLSDVLDKIIHTLLNQVVRKCIESATQTCYVTNGNITTKVHFRLNGLELAQERLQQEIDALIRDLADLKTIELDELTTFENLGSEVETDIRSLFKKSSIDLENEVDQCFSEKNAVWYNDKERTRLEYQQTLNAVVCFSTAAGAGIATGAGLILAGAPKTSVFGAFLSMIVGSQLGPELFDYLRGGVDEVKYEDDEQAKNFINQVTDMINKLLEKIYDGIKTDLENTYRTAHEKMISHVNQRAMNIIDRANERLNRTFNIKSIEPKYAEVSMEKLQVDLTDVGLEKRSYWSRIKQQLNGDGSEVSKTWFLSRSKLKEKCIGSLKYNLEQIEKNMVEKSIEEMRQYFEYHFDALRKHLRRYQHHAEWCLNDKKMTQENQEQFRDDLKNLKVLLTESEQKLNDFRAAIDWSQLDKQLSESESHTKPTIDHIPSDNATRS